MIAITQGLSNFTYSNIVETVDEYSSTTEYSLGDMVRVGSYHYKSTFGAAGLYNVGNNPLATLGVDWYRYEPSNLYSCLDEFSETKTVWDLDGIVEFNRENFNKLVMGNFEAKSITIDYLDEADNVISGYTQEYEFSNNQLVFDEWDYGYADFTNSFGEVVYFPLAMIGKKVRVTLFNFGLSTNCGFLWAGKAEEFGDTLENVSFPDTRIGNRSINKADLTTIVSSYQFTKKLKRAKELIDIPLVFIIDQSKNSVHQNLVMLGKITKCDGGANNFSKNELSFTIEQNIIT